MGYFQRLLCLCRVARPLWTLCTPTAPHPSMCRCVPAVHTHLSTLSRGKIVLPGPNSQTRYKTVMDLSRLEDVSPDDGWQSSVLPDFACDWGFALCLLIFLFFSGEITNRNFNRKYSLFSVGSYFIIFEIIFRI